MNRFDEIVTGSIDIAYAEALHRKNTEVAAVHLLYGLIANPATSCHRQYQGIKSKLISWMDDLPSAQKPVGMDALRPASDFSRWITLASADTVKAGRDEVTESDLLSFVDEIFPQLKLKGAVEAGANGAADSGVDEADAPKEPNFLINLCALAAEGKLDPVIGRTKEIRAVMEILGRRNKNNPVLVGAAGVGKTAIVEGLALAIQKEKVPDMLKGKTVYSLEMGSLTAGTKYRGDFEERIQKLLKFIKGRAGQAILFIDEIHLLVGAGQTEGAMDAANLLKPALARGDLHCIGATTPDEYRKYILGDTALDRRFRPVMVNEPTKEDAIEILMGVKERLETHHGIKISDEAVYASVFLSDQYITDKHLPDKAIDLIDEAASAMKLSAEAMPARLVELESEIRAKKIYAQAAKGDKDLGGQIKALEQKFVEGKREWDDKVRVIKRVSELKNRLNTLNFQLEQSELSQDYAKASEIKYALIPKVAGELAGLETSHELSKKEVAAIIARHTGIPEEKILRSQQENILELEDYLKANVFGQEEALHEIAQTLISSHAGLTEERRPLGSFMLMGPSGVGKTETARALCRFLFFSEENMVRLDMSEYSEKHAVAKLIGAPAGYVGYEDAGMLTEAVRKHPYSVILFDEIEKAHSDFADILLQILDDGHLTDNKGRRINFKNTIIFLTTNSADIERDFKPEVLGRLNAVLAYKPLDKEAMRHIVEKLLVRLGQRLAEKHLKVELDEECYALLIEKGYSPIYGARPLNAVFDKMIIRPLAHKILGDKLDKGTLRVSVDHGEFKFASSP